MKESSRGVPYSVQGQEVYQIVRSIQSEAKEKGKELTYEQATAEYHRRIDAWPTSRLLSSVCSEIKEWLRRDHSEFTESVERAEIFLDEILSHPRFEGQGGFANGSSELMVGHAMWFLRVRFIIRQLPFRIEMSVSQNSEEIWRCNTTDADIARIALGRIPLPELAPSQNEDSKSVI